MSFDSNSMSHKKVICVGKNSFGQLGIGSRVRSHPPYIPTQFGHNTAPNTSMVKALLHTAIAKAQEHDEDEMVSSLSSPTNSNTDINIDADDINDIQCGSTFTTILESSGKVKVCGYIHGAQYPSPIQLNIPTALKCVSIACGMKHCLILLEGGYVLSFGQGYFGQLGHGDDTSITALPPAQLSPEPKLIKLLDPSRRQLLSGDAVVTGITCGPYTSAFIVTETVSMSSLASKSGYAATTNKQHSVYMCGLNGSGQCGITKEAQVEVSHSAKCVIRPTRVNLPPFMFADEIAGNSNKNSSSRYITTGLSKNSFPFNLLGGSSSKAVTSAGQIEAGLPVYCGDIQMSLAKHHTILHHIPTNRLFSWGSSMYGQLGLSHLTNQDTININSIGIGSGNAHAAERRRIRIPTELTIPHLSGGKPINIQNVNGRDVTITGVLDTKYNRTTLNYVVGVTSGEHHNLLLSNKIYIEEVIPVPTAETITNESSNISHCYKLVNAKSGALSTATSNSNPIVPSNYNVNTNNTQIYSWGYNTEGQCGHSGNICHIKTPKILDFFNNDLERNIDTDVCVTSIHCGYNYSMATTNVSKLVSDVIIPGKCGSGNTFSGKSANQHKKGGGLNVWSDRNTSGSQCSVYGWGYNDGGWMGLVVPNAAIPGVVLNRSVPQQPPLPFIDTDSIKHGNIYQFNQARLFDCNCIVMTPTRIKSVVPPVVNAHNAGNSNEITIPSRPDSASTASNGEFYTPVAIRCGYTHSIICLDYSKNQPIQLEISTNELNSNSNQEMSLASSSSIIRNAPSLSARYDDSVNIRMDISDDSEEESDVFVDSKNECKKSSNHGNDSGSGLFDNKSSMLAGMFGSSAKPRKKTTPSKTSNPTTIKSSKSNDQLIAELFHIVKYHKIISPKNMKNTNADEKNEKKRNKNALVDEFTQLLNEITINNSGNSDNNNTESSSTNNPNPNTTTNQYNRNLSIIDVDDDNNTLLMSVCKYFMNPLIEPTTNTTGSTSSTPSQVYDTRVHVNRMELLHIMKYITSNCFDCINDRMVSIINHKNNLGNTALHYACHHTNNTNNALNTNNGDINELTGKHMSEFILSLHGTHTVIPVLDVQVQYVVDDCIANNEGLTCYEGLVKADLERL